MFFAVVGVDGSRVVVAGRLNKVVAVPVILLAVLGFYHGIRFGALFSIFSPAQLLPLLLICVSGFGVVR